MQGVKLMSEDLQNTDSTLTPIGQQIVDKLLADYNYWQKELGENTDKDTGLVLQGRLDGIRQCIVDIQIMTTKPLPNQPTPEEMASFMGKQPYDLGKCQDATDDGQDQPFYSGGFQIYP